MILVCFMVFPIPAWSCYGIRLRRWWFILDPGCDRNSPVCNGTSVASSEVLPTKVILGILFSVLGSLRLMGVSNGL